MEWVCCSTKRRCDKDFILPDFSTQQNHSQGTKRNRVQENIDRATIQSPSSNDSKAECKKRYR